MKLWLWLFLTLYLAVAVMGCAAGYSPGSYQEDLFQRYDYKPYWYLNEAPG
jgi:hypothetical protein